MHIFVLKVIYEIVQYDYLIGQSLNIYIKLQC